MNEKQFRDELHALLKKRLLGYNVVAVWAVLFTRKETPCLVSRERQNNVSIT
jgi:hypothetical protein